MGMRLIIQRVKKAKITRVKGGEVVGKIDKGLFVLVGFKKGDSKEKAEILAVKLSKIRVMADENDKMNLSLSEVGGSILVVSQFTLYADTSGGNRPSFVDAEDPVKAKELYDFFISKLREKSVKVETGSFGDYMEIETVIDGPVTILYEN